MHSVSWLSSAVNRVWGTWFDLALDFLCSLRGLCHDSLNVLTPYWRNTSLTPFIFCVIEVTHSHTEESKRRINNPRSDYPHRRPLSAKQAFSSSVPMEYSALFPQKKPPENSILIAVSWLASSRFFMRTASSSNRMKA